MSEDTNAPESDENKQVPEQEHADVESGNGGANNDSGECATASDNGTTVNVRFVKTPPSPSGDARKHGDGKHVTNGNGNVPLVLSIIAIALSTLSLIGVASVASMVSTSDMLRGNLPISGDSGSSNDDMQYLNGLLDDGTSNESGSDRTGSSSSSSAYLGVVVSDDDSETGAEVLKVTSGSGAEDAGIKIGDIITSLDGTTVTTAKSLLSLVGNYSSGDTVDVGITRDGTKTSVNVKLGANTASETSPKGSADTNSSNSNSNGGHSTSKEGLLGGTSIQG